MKPPTPSGKPHPFVADPEVPADYTGRGACLTCHLIGQPEDAHHALPEPPEVDAASLAAGERSEE